MGSPRANFSFLSVFSFIAVVQKNGKGGFFIEKLANVDGSTPHKLYNNEKNWHIVEITEMWQTDNKGANVVGKIVLIGFLEACMVLSFNF